nr:MAG TPA: baseplate protein [Caudoviricetes sp.]
MQTSGSTAIKKLIQLVKASLSGKLDKSGGTMTGNLSGQYITGTWLQTTAASDLGRTPGKIAVLDDAGWVYYRSLAEIKADIGASSGGGADISTILSKVYPVGSIYMSVNSVSPATLFGGTWERIKDQFLLAAGDKYAAGKTGGEATHTLTENEIPAHRHSIWFPNAGGEQSAAIGYPEAGSKNTWYAEASKTAGAGGGAAHKNMPPDLTVLVLEGTG